MNEIEIRLQEIARTPVLLVTSDYDGTLAPIAERPSEARPNREAMVAMRALASLPQTHVAIISGRPLHDLSTLPDLSDAVLLVGSHGSEFDPGFATSLSPELILLRGRLRDELQVIARSGDGLFVEEKPSAVALHYRMADERCAAQAIDCIRNRLAPLPGVHLKQGKKVLELTVVAADKGKALGALRHRVGATAALFLGDDVSDEDAFATLCGPDMGVKVGEGPTLARYRLADSVETARFLARLAEHREEWLKGSQAVPIEQHAVLSDQRTLALVTPHARITWLCLPRVDSATLFAELLGGPAAGYFAVRAHDGSEPVCQAYVGHSFVLKTEWPNFSVTDYLDCTAGRPFQRASRTDLIRVLEGHGRTTLEFAPRLDFGRESTRIRLVGDGLQIEGSVDPIVLRSPGVVWKLEEEGPHQRATAEFELKGQPLVLELRHGLSNSQELVIPEEHRRKQTQRFWTVWADQLELPRVHSELVRRSALVLRALCYGPTGAIVAAATTSLPEQVGGIRNWDYRFCWLRDAAISACSLVRLGATGPAIRLLDWLLGILDRESAPERLRPVYTVTGGHLGPEAEIRELSGYRGSRPVRIGNAAAQQLQLDVFGPIVELVALLADRGAALSAEHWRLTEAIVRAVDLRWEEPDHGIWEIRGARRHHVHSKVMCWVAVDRGLRVARAFSGGVPQPWVDLRDQIAAEVLENGWVDRVGAFTAAYGSDDLDAAVLSVGLSGLIAADDPRFRSTLAVIERALRFGPTVYRYSYDDGLPGREGGFHLCTAWLIESFVKVGRLEDARELLEQFVALFGPTGLAPEEYCPRTRVSLGNHPQAYTHAALIDATLAVASRH